MESGAPYRQDLNLRTLNNYDIAVQLDGDGQHPPCELAKIILPVAQKHCDVSIGSRFILKEGFQSSFMRRVGIVYFSWLIKKLIGLKIFDTTSGYRAINKSALEAVVKYYPDTYPEPETIIIYALSKLKIMEVPVVMKERDYGVSSISKTKSIYYMMKVSLGILSAFFRLKLYGNKRA